MAEYLFHFLILAVLGMLGFSASHLVNEFKDSQTAAPKWLIFSLSAISTSLIVLVTSLLGDASFNKKFWSTIFFSIFILLLDFYVIFGKKINDSVSSTDFEIGLRIPDIKITNLKIDGVSPETFIKRLFSVMTHLITYLGVFAGLFLFLLVVINSVEFDSLLSMKTPDIASLHLPYNKIEDFDPQENITFVDLRDLLSKGDFKAADVQIKKDLNIGHNNLIYMQSCQYLEEIDALWRHYSDGRFGFKIQSDIYRSIGGLPGKTRFSIFSKLVDWKRDEGILSYEELNFGLDAPLGHLPYSVSYGHSTMQMLALKIHQCGILD